MEMSKGKLLILEAGDGCGKATQTRLLVEALIKAGAFDSLHLDRATLLASIDLAFDYALVQEAHANQGGLFDMMDDGHGSSTQEPELVAVTPWDIRERLQQEKTALGFHLSGHLFDANAQEVRRFVPTPLGNLHDSREIQWLAGIVSDLRFINGNRGKLALFKLDDGSATLEASADESVFADANGILQEDALLIAQGRAQLDRFSGNLRLNVHTLIDLPTARCRYGKHLLVHVGPLAAQDAGPTFDRLFADHPPQEEITDSGDALTRGLPVRMRISLLHEDGQTVQGTVALGETRRFYPSDAALASWTALLPAGNAQIVYGVVDN